MFAPVSEQRRGSFYSVRIFLTDRGYASVRVGSVRVGLTNDESDLPNVEDASATKLHTSKSRSVL